MQPPLILAGKSAIGKTLLAKALLKDKSPLFMKKNLQGLKEFNSVEHNSLLIDDANLLHMNEQELIALLETDNPSSQRILYNEILTKNLTIIITANSLHQLFKSRTRQVMRRCRITKLYKPIIINVTNNVNSNNTTYNNIYNNTKVTDNNISLLKEEGIGYDE